MSSGVSKINGERLEFKRVISAQDTTIVRRKHHSDYHLNVDFLERFAPFTESSLFFLGFLRCDQIFIMDTEKYVQNGFDLECLSYNYYTNMENVAPMVHIVAKRADNDNKERNIRFELMSDVLKRELAMRATWSDEALARFPGRSVPYFFKTAPHGVADLDFLNVQMAFLKKQCESDTFMFNGYVYNGYCEAATNAKIEAFARKGDPGAPIHVITDGSEGRVDEDRYDLRPVLSTEYFVTKTILSRYSEDNWLSYDIRDVNTTIVRDNDDSYRDDSSCDDSWGSDDGFLYYDSRLPNIIKDQKLKKESKMSAFKRFNDFVTYANPMKTGKHHDNCYHCYLFIPDALVKHLSTDAHFACKVANKMMIDGASFESVRCFGDYLCDGCFAYWNLATRATTYMVDANINCDARKRCNAGRFCTNRSEIHLVQYNHM